MNQLKLGSINRNQAYLYLIRRLSFSLLIFLLILFIGYLNCIKELLTDNKKISSLKRPESGSISKNYDLIIKHGNKSENVNIDIKEKDYTKEEAEKIFGESERKLNKLILGKNKSLDNITDDINLVSSLENGVSVEWNCDSQCINYSGKINWEEIDENKEVKVRAILLLSGYKKEIEFDLILNKEKRDYYKNILDIVNKKNNTDSQREEVNLNDISKKYKVNFYIKNENKSWIFIIFAFVTGIIIFILIGKKTDEKIEKRREILEAEYAGLVYKITILQNSGMSILSAWDKIIRDFEKKNTDNSILYEEMKYARQKMKMGYSEGQAYLEFGRRCGLHTYIKFSNLLEQNIKKGTKGLKNVLDDEIKEAFEIRKKTAIKRGDKAGTKLLIPMIIMLVISMIIIMVPAILSFNL